MADYTIYSNRIWERMLEKYPDLRELTIKCECENNPQKAKKIRSSFEEFYNVFLDVIKLKLDYKVPYTKLFIHKLLENSDKPKEDSLEIKNYFLRVSSELFPEIRSESIE